MNALFLAVLAAILTSIPSLAAGLLLIVKNLNKNFLITLVSFAAGALLATSLLDLLPEAVESAENVDDIFKFTLAGIALFFFIERYLLWFHHHHEEEDHVVETPVAPALVIIGDSVHNFIDGLVIAGAFLADPAVGWTTTLAIFLHEVPQEISDFSVLLYSGMSKTKVILYNVTSALAAVIGAVVGYYALSSVESFVPSLLAMAAGMFIYIAGSDLIPEVHKVFHKKAAFIQSLFFVAGIVVIWASTLLEHAA